MATTICGKLNKDARQFQAGESTGFGIRLGVKFRDPKTKQDEWTNYQAVIFAKAPGQIQFYQSVLVAGTVVEVSSDQLKVDSFDGDNGPILSIDMLNAKIGFVYTGEQGQAPRQRQPQQQQQGQQQQQYAPQQQQQQPAYTPKPQQRPAPQQQGQQQYAPQQQQQQQGGCAPNSKASNKASQVTTPL